MHVQTENVKKPFHNDNQCNKKEAKHLETSSSKMLLATTLDIFAFPYKVTLQLYNRDG